MIFEWIIVIFLIFTAPVWVIMICYFVVIIFASIIAMLASIAETIVKVLRR